MNEIKVNGKRLCPGCGSEGKVQVCNGKYSIGLEIISVENVGSPCGSR